MANHQTATVPMLGTMDLEMKALTNIMNSLVGWKRQPTIKICYPVLKQKGSMGVQEGAQILMR